MSAPPFCHWCLRFLLLIVGVLGGSSGLAQTVQTRPSVRLAPGLEPGRGGRVLRVSVSDEAAFQKWLRQNKPRAQARPEPRYARLWQVRGITAAELTQCPYVSFVEAADRTARPERQLNGADFGANKVTTVHARYPQLTGQGLTVSVKESPLDVEDIDFKGRLLSPAPQGPMLNSHSTIMTTLIAGGGNSGPGGKGAAWRARIAQSSYDNLLPDDVATLASQGVSVQNHSYGVSVENFYGLEARAYDQQVLQRPELLHVFSSGNAGNQPAAAGPYAALTGVANLTGQFKNSKNTLTVGATDALGQVAPLSSRGPAADGRIKPELVAFGDGGTSDAAALVSGISLLAQHAYLAQQRKLPSAALVKAALLNSADDTGRPNVDFVGGYGQADALGAVETLLDGRFREGTVAQDQEQIFTLTVPAGVHRVKATLVWTDPEAAANASATLINDLDLTLTSVADKQRWLPWTLSAFPHLDSLSLPARRRPNRRDNAEQITLDLPAAGTYELRVHGYQVTQGTQAFSLAYEFESGLQWVQPTSARTLRAAEAAVLRWQWAGPASTAQLQYRPVGQTAWTTLAASVNLQEQVFRWTAPLTPTLAQVRLLTGAGAVESDTFFVASPLMTQVLYSCPEETLLAWERVPGATQYQLYRLGATHMEPYRLLTDTMVSVPPTDAAAHYFAVAPRVGGRVQDRGLTANISPENNGCYIQSFLPTQPVADNVRFDLLLGTTYQVQALTLERRGTDGSFGSVHRQTSVPGTSLVLTDPSPVPGPGEYRVRLDLTNGRVYYSSVETVFFVRNTADVLVYPVPVVAGEPLTVVGPQDQALHIRVFDLTGRLLLNVTTSSSNLQTLDTHGLGSGTFLMRVSIPGGKEVTRRILIL
ncbi:T9SS C-terminal target domain-containing protein [Hymenobacter sediminis]|uniref:S8 family peptidase n=1 Tax=Hymenobacter sediminis TaxID=2218621 RepID=UPI000DA68000|nr:S8 family peptidase [Hymenobacter sediminis]RPD50140.1 T9SS C-terminal target domain-containing protein [Hymenobacter sediminis]